MYKIGSYVKLKNTNLTGVILRKKKDIYTIRIAEKMIKTKEENILLVKHIPSLENGKVKLTLNTRSVEDTIMLRHQTVQEALEHLDKFIDLAICSHLTQIKIIHGKNGGILRKNVWEYLSKHPAIKEYRLGGYYEGSYGVTVAFLK